MKPQTISQKILAKKSHRAYVNPGEHIIANLDLCFAHDPVMGVLTSRFYESFGKGAKVWNPDKIALFQDHLVPAKNFESRNLIQIMDQFVEEQNIKKYFQYGSNYGVCHILILEEGLVLPGELMVGTDSHTVTAGAYNSFSTGVGVFDIVSALKIGKLWFTVPDTIHVTLNEELPSNVFAKDILLKLLGDIKMDGANGKTIEWSGETIENMSMDERATLCNMAVEAGATNGIMSLNKETSKYLNKISNRDYEEITSDPSANYSLRIQYKAKDLKPMVALPHRPDNVCPVEDIAKERIKVNQIYVGGCTGGKYEDIKIFTDTLRGERVASKTQVIVVPATMKIYMKMLEEGMIKELVDAGAAIESPGCKACYGVHGGVTGNNEVCLATINRNFIGRMGNPKSFIYLSSPYTAAKSAIAGYITC